VHLAGLNCIIKAEPMVVEESTEASSVIVILRGGKELRIYFLHRRAKKKTRITSLMLGTLMIRID
jgi:hypothetical protein